MRSSFRQLTLFLITLLTFDVVQPWDLLAPGTIKENHTWESPQSLWWDER